MKLYSDMTETEKMYYCKNNVSRGISNIESMIYDAKIWVYVCLIINIIWICLFVTSAFKMI